MYCRKRNTGYVSADYGRAGKLQAEGYAHYGSNLVKNVFPITKEISRL
jgi:hypothetical protein